MNTTIKIQPGALDDVPYVELARFLHGHGLELVYRTDGLYIRKATRPEPCECGYYNKARHHSRVGGGACREEKEE